MEYTPTFTNRVGFTSDPIAVAGWYENNEGGIIHFGATFRGVGVNILGSVAESFQTNLPLVPSASDGNQPVFEVFAKLTGNMSVISSLCIPGKVTPEDVVNSTSNFLVTFPLLTGLTGLTLATINIFGTYMAFP